MLCIEIEFLGGRYHATPWGRHVNEGVSEWPPSPYRIARALVDAWHRRRPEWDESRFASMLGLLSGQPLFWLPATGSTHIRLYLDTNTESREKKLVFDPFTTMHAGAKVVVCWTDVIATSQERGDLDELMRELSYLGRSESMVGMRLSDQAPERPPDAWPLGLPSTADVGESLEQTTVACVMSPDEYRRQPLRPHRTVGKGRKAQQIPLSWIEGLSFGTAELLQGWNRPPVLVDQIYLMRRDCAPVKTKIDTPGSVTAARYVLDAKVLPPVTATVAVAEQVRRKLMGIHRRVEGGDPSQVSTRFSGKGTDGVPLQGHVHAFFLPVDEDRDGFLDHLLVVAAEPFTKSELLALDRLTSLWQSNGRPDIDCVLTDLGSSSQMGSTGLEWVSATPFIPTRFYRRRDGDFDVWLRDQVVSECRYHGLPEPADVAFIEPDAAGVRFQWFQFLRSRKGEKPRHGYGTRLRFSRPVTGPVCLGYGCHFGMGRMTAPG